MNKKPQDGIARPLDKIVMIYYRLLYWFCDHFGERITDKQYLGHGNISERRGWRMPFKKTVWLDKDYA
uniref:Uncharacterized protein n=1 Tax=viral metagenome TaxID=1070528 RepID=A0A6M3LBE2_9ZZZZ